MHKILIVVLSVWSSAVAAEDWILPDEWTLGGFVDSYVEVLENLDRQGKRVVIEQPVCISACTFFLGAQNVCVDAASRFKFHGPSANITLLVPPVHHFMDPQHRMATLHRMRDIYDRWDGLGQWFMENAAGKYGFATEELSGQTLHTAFGVPICEKRFGPTYADRSMRLWSGELR